MNRSPRELNISISTCLHPIQKHLTVQPSRIIRAAPVQKVFRESVITSALKILRLWSITLLLQVPQTLRCITIAIPVSALLSVIAILGKNKSQKIRQELY